MNDVLFIDLMDKLEDSAPMKEAGNKLYNNYIHRPKSIIVELNIYRKYVPLLLDYVLQLSRINSHVMTESIRMHKKTNEKQNKRWTKEEDEKLIDVVSDGSWSQTEISAMFGRSPQSINARVSYLVGVKRLSQTVTGRFIGYINGQKTEADIAGTVRKEVI